MSASVSSCLKTPFKYDTEIRTVLKADLGRVMVDGCTDVENSEVERKLDILLEWLCITPGNTIYRVNTSKTSTDIVIQRIRDAIVQCQNELPLVSIHPHFPEVIVVHSWDKSIDLDLKRYKNEVIVDASCGVSVLRGSHIFAPGIVGIPDGLNVNDKVSVFADITGQCKKGLIKPYDDGSKIFLGNGIIRQTRKSLFNNNPEVVSGIAVYMTDVVSKVPQLNDNIILKGLALLQNLPSVICSHILNPQPGEYILDMCAAPGNKTTHISNLMKGKGTVIALERNKSKIEKLKRNCEEFSCGNVKVFCYDSTKAVSYAESKFNVNEPPFVVNSFHRVLLDTPCSALGQRPQLLNPITTAQLNSYVSQQRKLFSTAVSLLKPNGILVYSTCTVTIAENEGIVSWALKTFPCLQLKSIRDELRSDEYGTKGYNIDGLTEEQSNKLRRFGPEGDTIGFFVACFIKDDIIN